MAQAREAPPSPVNLWLERAILLAALVVLLTPLAIGPEMYSRSLVSKAALARAGVSVMVGLWIVLLSRSPAYRPRPSPVLVAFAVYIVVLLGASALGVSFTRSLFSHYERMLGAIDFVYAFLFVLVLHSVVWTGAGRWRGLLAAGLGVVLLVEIGGYIQPLGWLHYLGVPSNACRLFGTTGNPTYLGGLLVTTLPVGLALLLSGRSPGGGGDGGRRRWLLRGLLLAVLLLGVPLLVLTGSRGALLGLLAGMVVLLGVARLWGGAEVWRRVRLPGVALLLVVGAVAGSYAAGVAPGVPGCGSQTVASRLGATAGELTSTLSEVTGPAGDEEAAGGGGDAGGTGGESGSDVEGTAAGAVVRAAFGTRAEYWRLGLEGIWPRPITGWGPENSAVAYNLAMDPAYVNNGLVGATTKPHNKLVEEVMTTGIVGLGAYLALWGALAFGLLRAVRLGRQPLLALGVLGGLTAYFVQNLFLFDTPASFWHWVLLVAWASPLAVRGTGPAEARGAAPQAAEEDASADLERASESLEDQGDEEEQQLGDADDAPGPGDGDHEASGGDGDRGANGNGEGPGRLVRTAGPVLALALVVASIWVGSYQPVRAASTFIEYFDTTRPTAVRLDTAQQAFRQSLTSPNRLRARLIRSARISWRALSEEQQRLVTRFVAEEVEAGRALEPHDTDLVFHAVLFMQNAADTREEYEIIDPFIEDLERLAPNKPSTYWVRASQALAKRDAEHALQVIDTYLAAAPGAQDEFASLRATAQQQLGR